MQKDIENIEKTFRDVEAQAYNSFMSQLNEVVASANKKIESLNNEHQQAVQEIHDQVRETEQKLSEDYQANHEKRQQEKISKLDELVKVEVDAILKQRIAPVK